MTDKNMAARAYGAALEDLSLLGRIARERGLSKARTLSSSAALLRDASTDMPISLPS
jgi:hypothetical protein